MLDTRRRSRRAILAAALGAAAATVARVFDRPLPVRAADNETVLVGGEYTSTSVTRISNFTTTDNVLEGGSSLGIGVYGYSNVVGVQGSSGSVGVHGTRSPGVGVYGFSGISEPAAPNYTGVYGYAAQGSTARGVTGQTTSGRGVNGLDTSGRGAHGQATSGHGVHGHATSGIGGYFTATSGTALEADGPVRFSSAGVATVNIGNISVTVPAGVDLTASSKVLCTLMRSAWS